MKIKRGHEFIAVPEREIRGIQERNLRNQLSEEDKITIDAILSYFILNNINAPSKGVVSRISQSNSHVGTFHNPASPTHQVFT
jgi:hypothetical protein